MRVLLQRVSSASVTVSGRSTGQIDRGYLLLVGFTHDDDDSRLVWMADKVHGLRLFADAEGKMNLGLEDVGGAVLVVSQFTLYGDAQKGRRPSFIDAARPELAVPLLGLDVLGRLDWRQQDGVLRIDLRGHATAR